MRRPAVLLFALCALCCDTTEPARPQTVLYIDTDIAVPSIADTIRIETLDDVGGTLTFQVLPVPDASAWPVSIGVVPRDDGRPTHVRLRLYPGARSFDPATGSTLSDAEPAIERTIDRLVDLAPVRSGIVRVEVLLSGECLGIPADAAAQTSCVAVPRTNALPMVSRSGSPGDALVPTPLGPGPTRIGTWLRAQTVPCSVQPRVPTTGIFDDEEQISGGIFFLGDPRLAEMRVGEDVCAPPCGTVPQRMVQISPFLMDRYEVTTARWRAAIAAGFAPARGTIQTFANSLEHPDMPNQAYCTLGSPAEDPALPVTCVTPEGAEAFCEFDGGRRLPTEAEWEFAASGRGAARYYAWGDQPDPSCDLEVYGRFGSTSSVVQMNTQCGHNVVVGAARVDAGTGDQSLDGVMGLSGNVNEWTSDMLQAYGLGCWAGTGLMIDPSCPMADSGFHAARGGNWGSEAGELAVALRRASMHLETVFVEWGGATGFRCVRSGR